jgi:hypothetical protein
MSPSLHSACWYQLLKACVLACMHAPMLLAMTPAAVTQVCSLVIDAEPALLHRLAIVCVGVIEIRKLLSKDFDKRSSYPSALRLGASVAGAALLLHGTMQKYLALMHVPNSNLYGGQMRKCCV